MKDLVFSFHELFFYSRIEFWFCFKTCGSWGTRTFQLQLCISISFTLVKTSFCSIFVAKLPNL